MTLAPGTRIGPYEILSPLSVVGLGEIYRGRDHEQGRDVVIRALRIAADTDPNLPVRLAADVVDAGELRHPAIPQVYDVGRTPDSVYIVSEPFDGETLRALFDRGELTADAATECMAQVRSALAVAGRQRISHGSLSAENVLLTSDGRTVVLGFGLAATGGDGPSDEVAFDALCRDLLPEKPAVVSAPPWWRRSAVAVVIGLLLLAIGIALTVTRTVQRAGRSPLSSGGAAGDALIPNDSAADVVVPPPTQATEEVVAEEAPVPMPQVAVAGADAQGIKRDLV
jgi:serine/threonine protein kinase